MELDVVGGPAHAELLAAGGEFADEIRQSAVVRVATGLGAQDGDAVVGDRVPVDEELRGARVEEQEAGRVGRLHRVVEHVGVEGLAEVVGGEDVEEAVAHVGGGRRHGVEDLLHGRTDPFLGWTAPWRAGRGAGADEVEQVGSFGFVELQGAHDAFEDVLGRRVGVAALEAGVVLDADPGEHGDFFSSQAFDASVVAEDGKPSFGGRDPGPSRGEELANVLRCVHVVDHTTAPSGLGVPASNPHATDSLTLAAAGWAEATAGRHPANKENDPMRAAIFNGPGAIEVGTRPDPTIKEPSDAVVRVVMASVCGSDLWYDRGESDHAVGSIGHEFIGDVDAVGGDVTAVAPGDLVIAPFIYSDGTCAHCQNGVTISCVAGGTFGNGDIDGGQGEAVRVPLADGTLVKVPGSGHSDAMLRSLLTLSDVMSTGHHVTIRLVPRDADSNAERRTS